jgi:Tfp pilus assembly major pilin PilA
MHRKQQGITLMSFIMVLVVVGFFAMITMKLFPMYTEYNNLRGVMDQLAAQPGAAQMTQGQIIADLQRRFNIAYVESVKKENIKVTREGSVSKLNIAYEVRTNMFGNLDVVGVFDKTVVLAGSGPGNVQASD